MDTSRYALRAVDGGYLVFSITTPASCLHLASPSRTLHHSGVSPTQRHGCDVTLP